MSTAELTQKHDAVRRQFEAFPFPRRDPADELNRVYLSSLDDLGSIGFYCFAGRRNFRQGFRMLVAGGGTGDAVIDLAEQLKNTDAAIVYLDVSAASMKIAQQRANARGVEEKIEWIQASLLELPGQGLKPFDYINCCGVLHHLDNPAAGLKSLKSVLKPDGALGLMLYGKYGRTGVSQMRELMRVVNHDVSDFEQEVANTRTVIDRLPATNWCKRAVDLFPIYDGLDDGEIYDLFLNKQSRGYSLPEVFQLLDECGLSLLEHTTDQRALYEPQFAFPDGPLLAQIQKLPLRRQQAATELYWGAVTCHTFWASASLETVASLTDPDMVPFFSRFAKAQKVQESILQTEGDEWSMTCRLQGEIDVAITFHVAPAARRFVELINDERTTGEIIETILAAYDPRPPVEEAWKICRYVMEVLLRQDLLLLRHKSAPSVFASHI